MVLEQRIRKGSKSFILRNVEINTGLIIIEPFDLLVKNFAIPVFYNGFTTSINLNINIFVTLKM